MSPIPCNGLIDGVVEQHEQSTCQNSVNSTFYVKYVFQSVCYWHWCSEMISNRSIQPSPDANIVSEKSKPGRFVGITSHNNIKHYSMNT